MRLWTKLGFVMLIISIIISSIFIFTLAENAQAIFEVILIILQTIVLIISIFPVEKALKSNFDEDGNRIT